MRKFTDNQKLGMVAGAVVLLCGLGGTGVWWAKGKVDEKRLAIEDMRTRIADAEAKIAKIPAIEQDVIILRENLNEYVKILPEEQELSNFVRITNEFVSQSGVHMRQLVPGNPTKGRGSAFSRYSYKLELNATIWQLMQFMIFFENYERFVQVKDFQLASGQPTPSNDTVHTVSMTVETYVYTGKTKGKDVTIPNYANKVEKLQEEIYEARTITVSEKYKFQGSRGRRDIFMDCGSDCLQQSRNSDDPVLYILFHVRFSTCG